MTNPRKMTAAEWAKYIRSPEWKQARPSELDGDNAEWEYSNAILYRSADGFTSMFEIACPDELGHLIAALLQASETAALN